MQDPNLNQDHEGTGDNIGRDKNITHNYLPNDENRSELDVFNDYLATASLNQTATTSQPIAGKTVDDLDAKEVRRFLALPLVKDHFAKHKIAKSTPLAEKLRALTLMTNGYVVKGTFFCLADVSKLGVFGTSIAYTSFGVFATLDKTVVRKSEHVYGNLIQQYEEMHDLIVKELSPMEIINWNPRVLDYSIPQDVFRELLANAYIHRSYEHDMPYRIMIEVYPDRLVIKNAGNFPDNIDFNNLNNIDSVQRNPEIARLFFLHDVVELQGSGIARVQSILKARGFQPAVFEQHNGLVEVTIYKNKSIDELKEEYNNAIYNNDNEKALEIAKALVILSEKQLDIANPFTAKSYNNIAGLYQSKGDYDTALDYYKKAVNICEKALGTEHADTATSYNNIAGIYESKGDYDTALDFYKKALDIQEKVLGTEHPSTAISYNNIGFLYESKGDYYTALGFYQKALNIREKILGTMHLDTTTTYNNLGALYASIGDYNTALDFYKKALEIREKVLGTAHISTATSYNNIASIYYSKGEYDTALNFYKKDLAISEKAFTIAHPDTAISYNNIASIYESKGEYEIAIAFYKKALLILKKALPFGHPTTTGVVHNYNYTLNQAKESLPPATYAAHEAFLQAEFPDYLDT